MVSVHGGLVTLSAVGRPNCVWVVFIYRCRQVVLQTFHVIYLVFCILFVGVLAKALCSEVWMYIYTCKYAG